jgi:hypothetical protein
VQMGAAASHESRGAKKSDARRLKVLISAYACEPGRGSEAGVGWNVAVEAAPRTRVARELAPCPHNAPSAS